MSSLSAARLLALRTSPRIALVTAFGLGIGLLSAVPASAAAAQAARPASPSAAAGTAQLAAAVRGQVADGPALRPEPALPMATAPSIPVGSGPVHNGTFQSFGISDRVSLRVNVGSGDALLTTTDITVPEIRSSLTLGASYNSLLVSSGVAKGEMNAYGWRQRQGADVQLYPASGSVTYVGEDGTAGKFTQSGTSYTSPSQFHVTLSNSTSHCGGTGYTMIWHATGEIMCFTSGGILTSESDRNGNTNAFSYNASNLESKITFTPHGASSPTRTVTPSSNGYWLTGLSESGGAAGTRTVSYALDQSAGNLTSITQADGAKISFGYDNSHNLTSITSGAGVVTKLTYDSSHRVTSVTQTTTGSSTATTRFDYSSSTQTLVADPDTNQSESVPSVPHVTYTVDSSSSLITKVTDQDGFSRSTSYTSLNDVATHTNRVGGKTTNTFGSNSGESLTKSASPTGATSSWAYNNSATGSNPTANFQPSSSTDAQGNATAFIYDGAGNLSQSSNALAAKAKVTYNSDGTPATSTDPMNGSSSTNYGYTDGNHELNKITPPTGNSLKALSVTYDGFGRVSTVVDGAANTLTYTYDLADRVTKKAYTGGSSPVTVTDAYDGAGNLKTETDASGTTTYGYDGRNLVTSRTATSGGGTLSYGYDASANLTSMTDAGGTTTYVYSPRNLLNQITDPQGRVSVFVYDADGRRTESWFNTNSNESVWSEKMVTSYDSPGRISRIQAYENSSTSNVVFDTSYCYSPFVSGKPCPTSSASTDTSLVQYATNNMTSTTSQNTFDKGSRLTKATNVGGKTFSYGYDSDGNITSGAAAGSLSYNSGNQISSSGYGYDGAGNQTADKTNGTLGYNDAGQMTSATDAANGPEHFAYAGSGRDQLLSDGTATGITYGLATQGGQPWVQSYTSTLGGAPPVYVIRDQLGTPLEMIRNGNAWGFVTDNLGSVVNLINTSGATGATYTYDPYGNRLSESGGEDTINLIGYTGALTDPVRDPSTGLASTGYVHLGQRWLSSATGRFTTQDTAQVLADPQNGNRYAYAADNPTTYTDPTGQGNCSGLLGYAGIGGFLVGTAEGGVAIADAGLVATLAVGGILGGIFGIGLVVVALATC